MADRDNLHLSKHPLTRHKLSMMRDEFCSHDKFYRLTKEIGALVAYEATKDDLLHLHERTIKTPISETKDDILKKESRPVIVPILRAGLVLADGVRDLFPMSPIGHIGIRREPEAPFEVFEYLFILPDVEGRSILLVDPVVATGKTACRAIQLLEGVGVEAADIRLISIILAPEGLARITEEHPDIQVFGVSLEEGLDPNGLVVPGFGDAGDRLFGTE